VIPAWVDRAEYPFEPRAFASPDGTMRYLDEGRGPTVVMVHGTQAFVEGLGLEDIAPFGTALPRWQTVFDETEVDELPDVGHAPPEERGPELVPVLERSLRIEEETSP